MSDDLQQAVGKDQTMDRLAGWVAGLASICFFGLSMFLLRAYGLLHWGIISKRYRTLEEPLKGKLFELLGMLEVYHATALLAVVFGLRTFWTRPG